MGAKGALGENLTRFSNSCDEFKRFLKKFDVDNLTEKQETAIFSALSDHFLNPEHTVRIIENFRKDFLKILYLAINFDKPSPDKTIAKRNAIALSKAMEFHPDSESFILRYFEIWPAPFEDETCLPKKKKANFTVSEEELVEACYKFLKFKPQYFQNRWNWSDFLKKYLANPSTAYYANLTLALLTKMSETELNKLLATSNQLPQPIPNPKPIEIFPSDPSTAITTSKNLVSINGIYLPLLSQTPKTNSLVNVASTQRNLKRIALGIAANKAVSLLGAVGSGKTCLVEFLAEKTGRKVGKSFVKVQLGDQSDSKMLLGTYKCTDVPGEFIWQPGVLTQAVLDGSWLLLEDIDSASVDIASVLCGLIENGYLTVPGYHDAVPVTPGFQLFLTQRLLSTPSGFHKKHSNSTSLLEKHVLTIKLAPLTHDELIEIIKEKHPELATIATRILNVFTIFNQEEIKNSRLISTRDLFKWTQRAQKGFKISSQESQLKVLQDAIDIFCCSFANFGERKVLGEKICAVLGVVEEKCKYFLEVYKPNLRLEEKSLVVGRVAIPRVKSYERKLQCSYTRNFRCLLERIMTCVEFYEPVLLVGETGTGKTSCVQYLAHTIGQKLIVINMNQQSDSADLLGGYKPVDFKFIIAPIKNQFEKIFKEFFNVEANKKFLMNINFCFNEKLWSHLIKLMQKSQQAALVRLKQKEIKTGKDLDFINRWSKLGEKLTKTSLQIKHKNSLPFAFIQGSLVKAIVEGYWVLLDEINLANAETLETLSGLLEGPKSSLNLLEGGESAPLKRHKNFTLFACMNPSTDYGKKDLPTGLRNRFTEFFVDELTNKEDLTLLVNDYLNAQSLSQEKLDNIVRFYLNVRKECAVSLSDGLGHRPHFSLRSLCRALVVAGKNPCGLFTRSLYEAFCLSFLTQLDATSYKTVEEMIIKYIIGGQNKLKGILKQPIPEPKGRAQLQFEGYWISKGSLEPMVMEEYILTESVRNNLKDLVRIVSIGRLPVLLQGETSVGKTSLITYLAKASGYKCVRINNHEHTDLQEYIGSYIANEEGKLEFQEGCLVEAMRKGHWIILDELNLAPTDVLEALNRVLDDNRELYIPETQEVVKAHPDFMLFATQNPPGTYSGRKMLSRAFRNRFVELHFNEIPHEELEFILHKRCHMAPSYAKKMINVMKDLQTRRRGSAAFAGKHGFITLRDLFRWGERYRLASNISELYDWDQHIADEGYLLLAGRVRKNEEREEIAQVINKHIKRQVIPDNLFTMSDKSSSVTKTILEKIYAHKSQNIVWTYNMRQLAVLVFKAVEFKEPILLVGETGGGKTTVCKLIAEINGQELVTVNCHMHIESGDFIGGLRPVRDHTEENLNKLFEWVDGSLIHAMVDGNLFLADEISLADDSVLERLNSLLEPERSLLLAEKANSKDSEVITAHERFSFIGTMNPGGDFGKKELSPALRNRFTEIWCEPCTNRQDLIDIVEQNLITKINLQSKNSLANNIIDFVDWFKLQDIGKRFTISIRDILTWVEFINVCSDKIDVATAYLHGACLTFLDSFGSGVTSMENEKVLKNFQENCINFIKNQTKSPTISLELTNLSVETFGKTFGIAPFFIELGKEPEEKQSFSFKAPTTVFNVLRLVRSMQLKKPILLEGSPGVGKTSLVTALAKATRHKVFRVNLSDQTDISDLFGADLPVEDGVAGQFSWRDGPLLQALKQGDWILLDELNLASQSVLEGLNACLDHRGEIFIPELGKTFHIKPGTRFFGCQNPLKQGGSRRGLPQSFLNRFTEVFVSSLNDSDLFCILKSSFPEIPEETLTKMITFNVALTESLEKHQFGFRGSPWEFNLRDLIRWCEASIYHKKWTGGEISPQNLVKLIYCDRMRTSEDKAKIEEIFVEIFGVKTGGNSPVPYVTKDSLFLGDVKVLRSIHGDFGDSKDCLVLRKQLEVLRSLAYCVNLNWMAILVGGAGSGKSSVVRTLAKATGRDLRVLPVTSAMDTTDLLGGFEQTDYTRHLEDLTKRTENIYLQAVRSLLINEPAGSAGRAGALLPMTLWEKFVILQTETKQSTMKSEVDFCAKKLSLLSEILANLASNPGLLGSRESIANLQKTAAKIRDNIARDQSLNAGGKFEWVDSILIKCLQDGTWLLVDNVNLCSPAVLDRLNGLLEPNGVLTIGERGMDKEGRMVTIKPHPEFRLFLTMDPKNGEISRAMRNRGIEIFILNDESDPSSRNELDTKSLIHLQGLTNPKTIEILLKTHDKITENTPGEKPSLSQLVQASFLISQKILRGEEDLKALREVVRDVYDIEDEIEVVLPEEIEELQLEKLTLKTQTLKINSDLARVQQQFQRRGKFSLIHYFTLSSLNDLNLRFSYLDTFISDPDIKHLAVKFKENIKRIEFANPDLPLDFRWIPDVPVKNSPENGNKMFFLFYYLLEMQAKRISKTSVRSKKAKTFSLGEYLLSVKHKEVEQKFDDPVLKNVLNLLEKFDNFILNSKLVLSDEDLTETISLIQFRLILETFLKNSQTSINDLRHNDRLLSSLHVHYKWFTKYSIQKLQTLTKTQNGELESLIRAINSNLTTQFNILQKLGKRYQKAIVKPPPLINETQIEIYTEYRNLLNKFDLYSNLNDLSTTLNLTLNHKDYKHLVLELKSCLDYNLTTIPENYSKTKEEQSKLPIKPTEVVILPLLDYIYQLKLNKFRQDPQSFDLVSLKQSSTIPPNLLISLILFSEELDERRFEELRGDLVGYLRGGAGMNPERFLRFGEGTVGGKVALAGHLPVLCYLVGGMVTGGEKLGVGGSSLGGYRESLGLWRKVRAVLWKNIKGVSDEDYDYVNYERSYLKKSFSKFVKTLSGILELDYEDEDVFGEVYQLKLITAIENLYRLDKNVDKTNDRDNLIKLVNSMYKDMSSLNSASCEVSKLNEISNLYLVLSYCKALLSSKLALIDPLSKIKLRENYCEEERGHFEELRQSFLTQEEVFSDCKGLNPLCEVFESKIEELRIKGDELRKNVAVRPKDIDYQNIRKLISHGFATVLSPTKLLEIYTTTLKLESLISSINGNDEIDVKPHETSINLLNSTITSLDSFVLNLKTYRYTFPDIITSLLGDVSELIHGLNLNVSLLKKLVMRYRNMRDEVDLDTQLVELVRIPSRTREISYLGESVKAFLGSCLDDGDQSKWKGNEENFNLLKCGIIEIANICKINAKYSQTLEIKLFQQFDKIIKMFVNAWKKQEEDLAVKKQEEESLYKTKTKCDESEEKEAEEEFKKLFPSYHDSDFSDFQTKSLDDEEAMDVVADEFSSIIKLEDLYFVSRLHSKLVTGLTKTEWLNPAVCPDGFKLDVFGPIQMKFKVFKLLVEKCVECLSYKLDGEVVGSLSVLAALVQNYGEPGDLDEETLNLKANSKYNFYKDPNVEQIKPAYEILKNLQGKIEQLLQEWPDHPTLQIINGIIERILNFDLTSPIPRFLTGFDVLLTKCHEWEENAHSGVSLSEYSLEVSQQIVTWRKLEMNHWKNSLDNTHQKMVESTPKYWFYIYDIMNEYIVDRLFETTELISTLQKFILQSNMAEFQIRLELLNVFHCHATYLPKTKERDIFISVLWNLYKYYEQFLPNVVAQMKTERTPLEKKLKDYIKIIRWKDISYWALKETLDKTHKIIFKYMREYQDLLKKPASPLLVNITSQQEFVGVHDRPQRTSPKRYHYTQDSSIYITKLQLSAATAKCDIGILANPDKYFKKSKSLAQKIILATQYPHYIKKLDCFVVEIINTITHLQSLEVDSSLTKEKRISQGKGHLQQKQRALTDLFQGLAKIGLSFRKGLMEDKCKDITTDFVMKPIDLFAALNHIPHSRHDDKLLILWDGVEVYLRKSCMRMEILENAIKNPAKDLGLHNVERCKGFAAHLMILGQKQKSKLIESTNLLYHLRYYQKVFTKFTENTDYIHLDNLNDLKRTLIDTLLALKQMKIVLSSCPEENYESPEIPTLAIERRIFENKRETDWGKANSAADFLVGKVEDVLGILGKLKVTLPFVDRNVVEIKWVSFGGLSGILEDLEKISGGIEEVQRIFEGMNLVEPFDCLKKRVQTAANNLKIGNKDETSLIKLEDFQKSLESLTKTILITIQNLHKKYENVAHVEESDENLVDSLLNLLVIDNIFEDVSLLNMETLFVEVTGLVEMICGFNFGKENCGKLQENMKNILPFFEQAIFLYQYFISQQVSAYRITMKMSSILLNIFIELATKGFCTPQEVEEEEGKGEGKTGSGMGLGDGKGEKDVSDKIESEDQLDDAQPAGQEKKKEEEEECKENEKGIEMSEDFDAALQDKEKKEKDEEDEQSNSESDGEEQMGDVENDADQLDKEIWGSDDEEPAEDEEGDGKEKEELKGDKGETEGEQEMAAKDGSGKQENEEEEKGKEKDEKKEEINEMDEKEYDDDQVDPYHGNQPELPEPEAFDLPDDINIDEDGDEEKNEENPFDIDAIKDQMPEDEKKEDEAEGEKTNEEQKTDDVESSDDDEDANIESKDKGEENEGEEEGEDNGQKESLEKEKEDTQKEGVTEKMDQEEEAAGDDASQSNSEVAAPDTNTADSNVETNPKEEKAPNQSSKDDASQEENPEKAGTGQSQMEESNSGHKGDAVTQQTPQSKNAPEKPQNKRNKPGDAEAERSLGDPTEPLHKRMKTIDVQSDKDNEEIENEKTEAEIYQHIKDAKKRHEQMLDSVKENDGKEKKDVPNLPEEESEEAAMETTELAQEEGDVEMVDVENLKPEATENEKGKRNDKLKQSNEGDIDEEGVKDVEIEGENVITHTVERGNETEHFTQYDTLADSSLPRLSTENINQIRSEIEQQLSIWNEVPTNQDAQNTWKKISAVTLSLAQNLSEQLRLVLEPTQASHLKGDYRTGKRINMRKIIPYIASQFRKDKIWLRRTKPSKRDYQIVLAIDDSSSMNDNRSKELAFESLALISKALSLLESGELSILSFGENPEIVHKLTESFTENSGSKILQKFKFDQKKTCVAKLLDFTTEMLGQIPSKSNSILAKLLVIVSDGRGIFSEGENYVQQAVRRSRLANIFTIFVIIDNPENRSSILDIRKPIFKDGKIMGIKSYMDAFPFPFYLILKDINSLPNVLSDALRQWFELVSSSNEL